MVSISREMTLSNLELSRFFFALALLLMSAHCMGYLFNKFKLPRVGGEIVGGILLGPSVLGLLYPSAFSWIFAGFSSEGKMLSLVYNTGMVLLMFISGLEVQKSVTQDERKDIVILFWGSTLLPFIAGFAAPSFFNFSLYLGSQNNLLALTIVIAIAASVTSIPVLSKIFLDLDIIQTHFAKIILTTATLHDVVLWVALAIATGLSSNKSVSLTSVAFPVLITIVFFLVSLFWMPRIVKAAKKSRYNLLNKSSSTGFTLFICLFFVAMASLLDVNIIFGALLAGIVFGSVTEESYYDEKKHIKEIATGFFIPIYFAIVGLKLDLIHHFEPVFFIQFLLFTSGAGFIGSALAALYLKKDTLSLINICMAMTTRGGPGIVLATVAFDQGIINEVFFVTLVLIAIVTSVFSGYWFRYVLSKGWKLLSSP